MPNLDQATLEEIDSRISTGENTINDIKNPLDRDEYLTWKQSSNAVTPQPTQQNVSNTDSEEKDSFNIGLDFAKGIGEVARTTIGGMVGQIAGGYAGMFKAATTDADFISKDVVDTMQNVSGSLTYQPRSLSGQVIMQMIGTAAEPITRAAEAIGTKVTQITGSPTFGGGVQTLIELGPVGFGTKSPIKPLMNRNAAATNARRMLEDAGVNPRLSIQQQLNQVPEAAAELTRGTRQRAQGFLDIQSAVRRAKQSQRNMISEFYKQARESGTALVPKNEVKVLNETMGATLAEGFADANIPAVRNLLDNFVRTIEPSKPSFKNIKISRRGLGSTRIESSSRAAQMPKDEFQKSVVELNEIAKLRRDANRFVRSPNAEVSAAATAMKGNIDNWLNAQFDRDMISGVPDAIDKWKNANTAYREYSDIFNANKSLKNIVETEASAEMIADWIHGANAVGAKSEASLVVNRLNKVLGKNSDEMQTLRNGVAFDIVYPILRKNLDDSSLSSFQTNYTDFMLKNPSLAESLFDSGQLKNFSTLSKLVRSANKLENPQSIIPKLDRSIAIALFPKAQPLATGATVLGVLTNAVKRIRNIGSPSAKKQIYSGLTGFDATKPLIRPTDAAKVSFMESAINQEDYWDDISLMLTESVQSARQKINKRVAEQKANTQ
jgi:hypothetical protein|tara:strand:+ start:1056 stop:3050 length:1995 start_codon:yes stop_codon:yes gene_type:complete